MGRGVGSTIMRNDGGMIEGRGSGIGGGGGGGGRGNGSEEWSVGGEWEGRRNMGGGGVMGVGRGNGSEEGAVADPEGVPRFLLKPPFFHCIYAHVHQKGA